ncbi:hypothetical protein BGZ76_007692 [Entomortierella beljakovae]|nr:hypothetical protein BGZ76_007692 [Entomortierella beljakovae]
MRTGLRSSQKNYSSSMATPPLTPKISHSQIPCDEISDTKDPCRKRTGGSITKSSPTKKKSTKTSPFLLQQKVLEMNKNEISCEPLVLGLELNASRDILPLTPILVGQPQVDLIPVLSLDFKKSECPKEGCNITTSEGENEKTNSPPVPETHKNQKIDGCQLKAGTGKKARGGSMSKTKATKTKQEKNSLNSLISDTTKTIARKRRKPLTMTAKILPKSTLPSEDRTYPLSSAFSSKRTSHRMSIGNLIIHEEQTGFDFKARDDQERYTPQEATAAQVIAELYRECSVPRIKESCSPERSTDRPLDNNRDYFNCGYRHDYARAEFHPIMEGSYSNEYREQSNTCHPTVPIQVSQDVFSKILAMQQSIYDWGFRDGMLQRIKRDN